MECFDLFDACRLPTGKTIVRGETVPEGFYRQVIHVCIFNRDGQMLIQQRQPFKKKWGNLWDVSVGGCAVCGETSRQAAHREVMEELGLDVVLTDAPAFSVTFSGGFDDYYFLQQDISLSDLRLQKEEVQSAAWASLEDVQRMIRCGDFIPYHPGFIEFLFHHPAGYENSVYLYTK